MTTQLVETAQDVAGSIPVFGGIAKAAIGLFSGIRGATKHPSWDSAKAFGEQYGAVIENAIVQVYGANNMPRIAVAFRSRMIAYCRTLGDPPDPAQRIAGIIAMMNDGYSLQNLPHIATTFLFWNLWAMCNSDAESTTDYPTRYSGMYFGALKPAILDVVGSQAYNQVASQINTVSASATQIASATQTGGTQSFSLASFSSNWVMILIVVGLFASVAFGLFKR